MFLAFRSRITTLSRMSNSFDDMPFFDEEPSAPRRETQGAAQPGGLGIAARAMAAREQSRPAQDYLSGLNPEQREAVETLDGPVLVMTDYLVPVQDEEQFLAAMAVLGRSRQRTGAARWRLYRSVEREQTFVETFIVRSWGEHLHQHHTRQTGQDLVIEQNVERYAQGKPVSHHLIAVPPQR